jgi:hypothetical protein
MITMSEWITSIRQQSELHRHGSPAIITSGFFISLKIVEKNTAHILLFYTQDPFENNIRRR